MLLELDDILGLDIFYKPGDHLGVFACNRAEFVERILQRVQSTFDADTPIELQMQKQAHTPNGINLMNIYPLSLFLFSVMSK